MERYTPSGVPICDGDAFGWRMENGLLSSPTHIAQRGYACGLRHGLAAGSPKGGSGGGSSDTSWQRALSGETMPAKPTVSESNAALRRVWAKLGGSLATCLALCTAAFGLPGDGYVKKAPLGQLSGDEPSHVVVTNVELGLLRYDMEQYADRKWIDAVETAEALAAQAVRDGTNYTDRVTADMSARVAADATNYTDRVAGDLRAEIASVDTNSMRRLDDNVSRVTSARRWSHGEIAWGDAPQELEDQPSYSAGGWTWAIRGSGQTAWFAADGDETADTLEFSGFGLAAGLPPFVAGLLPPASTSNETFVTETFVTSTFGSVARAAFDSAVPGMRDLLAKTNATDISSDFATNSLVGRLANDSLGFDVRGNTLVLVDGTNDLWSCAEGSGGGVDTNTVREIVRPMLDAALEAKRDKGDMAVYAALTNVAPFGIGHWMVNDERLSLNVAEGGFAAWSGHGYSVTATLQGDDTLKYHYGDSGDASVDFDFLDGDLEIYYEPIDAYVTNHVRAVMEVVDTLATAGKIAAATNGLATAADTVGKRDKEDMAVYELGWNFAPLEDAENWSYVGVRYEPVVPVWVLVFEHDGTEYVSPAGDTRDEALAATTAVVMDVVIRKTRLVKAADTLATTSEVTEKAGEFTEWEVSVSGLLVEWSHEPGLLGWKLTDSFGTWIYLGVKGGFNSLSLAWTAAEVPVVGSPVTATRRRVLRTGDALSAEKARAALDSLDPSSATVSQLINALKEALEE